MSVADEERWLRDEQQTLWPTVPFDEFLTECAKSYSPYEGYNVPHYYVDAARRVMASRKEQA